MSGKDELQSQLDDAKRRFSEVYGGEVTTYAATPKPDRKAWKRKPTWQELAYKKALEEAETNSGKE